MNMFETQPRAATVLWHSSAAARDKVRKVATHPAVATVLWPLAKMSSNPHLPREVRVRWHSPRPRDAVETGSVAVNPIKKRTLLPAIREHLTEWCHVDR